MGRSSNKIEIAAVNCITDAFDKSERLETFIPIGDKEPVWDGNIYIKHGNKRYSRILTQVKGKTVKSLPKNPSYDVSLVNLENYKRDGGIVYFVVFQLKDGTRFPYYRFLAPVDLKRYIQNGKGKSKISISLDPLGPVVGDLERSFIQFYYDCKQQTSFASNEIMTMDEAIKNGYSLNYRIYGATNQEEALRYMSNNYTYLYANVGIGGKNMLVPVGDSPVKIFMLANIDKEVKCNGVTYFTKYQDGINENRREVLIGGFLRMVRDKNEDTAQLNIQLNTRNLRLFFHQLSFFRIILMEGKFYLGEECVGLNNLKGADFEQIDSQYEYWSRVIATLKKLHCNLDFIDITGFGDREFGNLDLLCKAILDNEDVIQDNELPIITTMELGNYKVLLHCEKLPNGKYRVSDFFSLREHMLFAFDNDKGQKIAVSIFSVVLQRDDFASIINIDYENIINSYEDVSKYSWNISEQANMDVLRMISIYDKSAHKDRRILEHGLKLTDWIIATCGKLDCSHIYKLNRFQINKRLNGMLSQQEKDEIIEICDSDVPMYVKWASNLLIEDYTRADKYWNRMTEENRQLYSHFPIYYFQEQRI